MAKQSQLEKAIAQLDSEIAVLVAAKDRLVKQQTAENVKARKPRVVARVVEDRPA